MWKSIYKHSPHRIITNKKIIRGIIKKPEQYDHPHHCREHQYFLPKKARWITMVLGRLLHALNKITVKNSYPYAMSQRLNGLTGKCKVFYVIGSPQWLLSVLYSSKRSCTKDSIFDPVWAI